MLVSTSSAQQLAKRGCVLISAAAILIRSALPCVYRTSDKDDNKEHQPRSTLPKLGSFFHVQSPHHVKRAFIKYRIIPDVLDKAPTGVLRVHYASKRGLVAKFGNVMNPTELDRRPHYMRWPSKKDTFYTLFMIDPDAAPYPNASWLNWYVVNIREDRMISGFNIAKYIPPRPNKGSGLHRIVFLAYEQPLGEYFFYDEMGYNDTRYNFTLRKILTKYNYDRPVAGNFFQTQWMKPVPTRKPRIPTTTPVRDDEYYDSGKYLNGTI